jgi:hypothetical protein
MTSNIDVKLGEMVLEIGTGPGCQSAYLAHLINQALRAAGVALATLPPPDSPNEKVVQSFGPGADRRCGQATEQSDCRRWGRV